MEERKLEKIVEENAELFCYFEIDSFLSQLQPTFALAKSVHGGVYPKQKKSVYRTKNGGVRYG